MRGGLPEAVTRVIPGLRLGHDVGCDPESGGERDAVDPGRGLEEDSGGAGQTGELLERGLRNALAFGEDDQPVSGVFGFGELRGS